MSVDPDELLALAVEAARRAGTLIVDGRPDVLATSTKSSSVDVATEMDRACEELLASILLGARPGDGMLGEEAGERPGTSGVRWIVDPIDGTTNYLYQRRDYAVSIAADVNGEVVAGVVLDAATGDLFEATRGGGARRNGRPLSVSAETQLTTSLIGTGFSYDSAERAAQGRTVARLLPQVRDIRRCGSAALDICSVAAGHLDGYFERNLNLWDVAAGLLIAREAGAATALVDAGGSSPTYIVSTPGIHDALTSLLVGERSGTRQPGD